MGGEQYCVKELTGVYGPLMLPDRSTIADAPEDSQPALYIGGGCSLLVGGQDARTTSSLLHQAQSTALVAREGDYPQECVGVYACMLAIKDGVQLPYSPTPLQEYITPNINHAAGPTVSAGGRQTWEPLPDFLKEYHIQYFTDTGGRRWRKGGGFTLRLSMGGVCLRETALREVVTYHETNVYVVCSLTSGKGQPELMQTCGSRDCSAVSGPCLRHVLWKSQYGCPLCRNESFSEIYSPCVRGHRDISSQALEQCFRGLEPPAERSKVVCSVSIQDLLSKEDITGLGIATVVIVLGSCVMYERYRKYKSLYSKYRNMRPGTKELQAEPGVGVAEAAGGVSASGGRDTRKDADFGLPRASL